jgi:hypothetical protein
MPIERAIYHVGRSYAVSLPKSWVDNAEKTEGKRMIKVAMEVNGNITLTPIFEERGK